MGEKTAIQWTDNTFNPWWGCTKVGPGCDHCYADAFDRRTGGAHWGTGVPRRRTSEHNWNEPRRWDAKAAKTGTPIKVFCASMCDVFDNEVPEQWRADLWQLILATQNLRWQLLTKRIGNVPKMLPNRWPLGFEHVGIMATIVNQEEADRDGPKLRAVKDAGTTWVGVSYEPAIGPVNWQDFAGWLDWLIIGGESGPGARPFNIRWADWALRQDLPTTARFVKQLGAKPRDMGEQVMCWDKKGGDWSEWPAALRVRDFPAALRKEPSP